MKTLAYNPKQEIMTAITVLIISLAVLTTVQGQEKAAQSAPDHYQMVLNRPSVPEYKLVVKTFSAKEKEDALTVEPWMGSNYYWGAANLNEQPENENPLAVEGWMNSNNYWGTATEELEAEPALAVENWMNANSFWGTFNASEVQESEAPLAVEQWMHCNAYWLGSKYCNELMNELAEEEAPLNVENWMASNSFWGQENNQQLASN